MDWIQVLTIVGTNVGLFIWLRTESNSDRRDFAGALRLMQTEIQTEMKDFHGRLCAIEARNKEKD